ncbi:NAD(P)-dependent dehydrogenase (short-subunit alcohol dehydrogenase family) [Rhodococcus sp. PvR044]|jgi:NAD(P)-dependent dehydrogenase (short-subunit alcohol dehydrogenase family)|uniref:SDR family NAD(P)-dependent oxidoreductase n=1 Tax=unclassified Rhodococcus (in: high G+C Gram-positive bacteria) TaxID=192944 RepID=UPI000BD0A140|nr:MULTISPECIES: oxidoreductase [unclassified Rhodococcus (in: high G+C Gram-positive bacteria)]PTR38962.1 NAD(P)-dependent dehydrogenase (short-subunit alcohol dehydrogenase family) [Rhodococcus sp. OK611]SNX92748.1 NAD(P)-dependent dehydrogenase, short-chain alcohol dehydrogenase family [Rhodococcus sp. OK270]
MDLHLDGKIAVVTGASKGIGLAITDRLAEAGAHIVAGSRTRSTRLEELESDGRATFVPADLSTSDGPVALVEAAARLGGVDILVNNAGGVTPRPGGFVTVTDEDWNASWSLGVMAAVRTTRAAIPEMVRRGGGAIVTIGSVNAFYPDPGVVDYCAVKAAVTNLTKALSKELGPKGIRANSISPGPVLTDLWLGEGGVAEVIAKASGASPQDVADGAVSGTPTGRFTTPDEVADLALFLASDRAANITGADMTIDGGFITTV